MVSDKTDVCKVRVHGGQAYEKNTSPTKILLLIVHKAVIYKSRVFVNSAQCMYDFYKLKMYVSIND